MPNQQPEIAMPTVESMGWRRLAVLGMEAGAQRVLVDKLGNWWITRHDMSEPRMIRQSEALELCQNLCESFGLVVINEPDQWGNDPQRCSCETVPARVVCAHCDDMLTVADPRERRSWGVRHDG